MAAKEHKGVKEVKIMVLNEAGDISYNPAVLHVSRKETIKWTCESGPFTISFADAPLEEGHQLRATEHHVLGTVSGNAAPGVHCYAVAASFHGKIYLDAGCPQIVVN